MHSFVKFLVLPWFYSFWNKAAVILFKIFSLFFFHVDKVFFGTPKREATSLWGVPFSNSLSALYFILYDLFSARRFAAATDAMIVKFQNVDKQCIR